MTLRIPDPLRAEHEELYDKVARAARARGPVGEAARALVRVLQTHLAKEEKYALPPLGLLTLLSTGHVSDGMAEALTLTEKLRTDLPRILAEHQEIAGAAERLAAAARGAKKDEYVRLAETLLHHTQIEGEVLYPASLLVGEYLKCKLNRR